MVDELVSDQAFERIQKDPELYRQWVHAKTESERTKMLVSVAFDLGYECAERELERQYLDC